MTSPVNLPASASSHSVETSDNQAASGQNKRSAPSGSGNSGSGLIPKYSAEILQAAPLLNSNNTDQVSDRPAKMQRRGGISTSSQLYAANLQPSQSGLDRAADDTADLLAGSSLTDQLSKKP